MLHKVWVFVVFIIFFGCQKDLSITTPSLEQYQLLDPNLQLEMIAFEPLIEAPIALDIDGKGRIWVLEMPDYMPDIDGNEEGIPRGRIVILDDLDSDGIMDNATVFLDSLHQPRAICLIDEGILYAESPNLWFISIEEDQPGDRVLVDSMYAVGGNVEHQPNGLLYNLDNWIYSAKSKKRYRRIESEWITESTAFRGQWGISHDQWGRLYYNDNSNGLYADLSLPNTISKGKFFETYEGIRTIALTDRSIFPAHPTAINRGYIEGMLDSNQVVQKMTSTCGPLVYAAENLGQEYINNGFICVPEGNLIKRVSIDFRDHEIEAANWYKENEWLRSTDEGFRPVNIFHSPDGAIYVVDFHRGVIQHKTYMTDYLRNLILDRSLDSIYGYGRILKISNKHAEDSQSINFSTIDTKSLIQLLHHPNILIRKKAQQEIIRSGDQSLVETIVDFLNRSNEIGKIHALYTLEGFNQLKNVDFINTMSADHPWYNSHLVLVLSKLENQDNSNVLLSIIERIASFNHRVSDLYCLFAMGILDFDQFPRKLEIINQLADRYSSEKVYAQMLIAGHERKFDDLYNYKEAISSQLFKNEIEIYRGRKTRQELNEIYVSAQAGDQDDKTRGRTLFNNLCSACHGQGGRGIPNLAPTLQNASLVNSGPEYIALSILTGLQGPVTIDEKRLNFPAAMPGLSDNSSISDEDIADIANYISNSFVTPPEKVRAEEVRDLRKIAQGMDKPSTEVEIINRLEMFGIEDK